ncbi:hypothetical protein EDD85DRAFT_984906 [Armillaria nabsnona]|nr:hypothetical protein EDD85DRAFT_984906 [Armillaria nabsnona]
MSRRTNSLEPYAGRNNEQIVKANRRVTIQKDGMSTVSAYFRSNSEGSFANKECRNCKQDSPMYWSLRVLVENNALSSAAETNPGTSVGLALDEDLVGISFGPGCMQCYRCAIVPFDDLSDAETKAALALLNPHLWETISFSNDSPPETTLEELRNGNTLTLRRILDLLKKVFLNWKTFFRGSKECTTMLSRSTRPLYPLSDFFLPNPVGGFPTGKEDQRRWLLCEMQWHDVRNIIGF